MVQCVSVGVGDTQLKKEDTVLNISKHLAASSFKDLKIRQPRQADAGGHSDPLDWLRASVPGEPGQDYPVLSAIQVRNNTIDDIYALNLQSYMFVVQETDFSCSNRVAGGYYADPDQRCQAYHVCLQVCFVIFLFNTCLYDVYCTTLSLLNLLMAEMRFLENTQNNF